MMDKLSISSALRRIQRRRVFTLLACLALTIAAGQMTLFRGDKRASARYIEDGVSYEAGTDTCYITRSTPMGTQANPQRIPAFCEGRNVVVDGNGSGLYIDTSLVRVWQSAVSVPSACDSTYIDGDNVSWDLLYLDDLAGQCVYQQRNAISLNYIVTFGPNLPLRPSNGNEYTIRVPKTSTNIYNDYFFQLTGFDANGCVSPASGNNFQLFGFKNGLCYYNFTVNWKKYYTQKTPNTNTYTAGSDCTSLDAASAFLECDSKRHFKNLTLENGAILTHAAVTVHDMYSQSSNHSFNGSAAANVAGMTVRWKKVDLVIDAKLDIDTTSKIDVTGQGYPGGASKHQGIRNCPEDSNNGSWNGYGPGGGIGGYTKYTNTEFGTAGGYGGFGQTGTWGGEKLIYNADLSVFEFGSGGGGNGIKGCTGVSLGGAGGGRIRLDVGSISLEKNSDNNTGLISSNGDTGSRDCFFDQGCVYSGNGSGGSIFIMYRDSSSMTPIFAASALPGRYDTNKTDFFAGIGTVRSVNASVDTANSYDSFANITAMGGAGQNNALNAAGGGGRIYIEKIQTPTTSVTKRLYPINRPYNASPVNTNFNPYAMQVGDLIKVELKIGSYTGSVSMTDQFLKLPGAGTAKCEYYSSAGYGPDPAPVSIPAATDTEIAWSALPASTYANGLQPITYYCKVRP